MSRNLIFLLLATCVSSLFAQVQENDSKVQYPDYNFDVPPRYLSTQKKYTFAIQPFQWFNWGWRFDFEMRLGDSPGWLQFGPTVYSATKSNNSLYYGDMSKVWYYDDHEGIREPFTKLNGAGIDINYKRFFDPNRSVYYAAGISYARFNIDYMGSYGKWNDYIEDGLLYHEYIFYPEDTYTQHINRMSVNQYIGFQPASRHAFLFDMFIGISYRHAFSDKDKNQFDNYTYSYGFTGFVFTTGIRFGFGIK